MGKIKTLAIFAAGYVIGARAGHGRYEQLRNWAQEMWGKPVVQEQVGKVSEQAGNLAQQAKEHLPGNHDAQRPSTPRPDARPDMDNADADSAAADPVTGHGHG